MGMKFVIGKTYEHENGTKMTIIGRLKTHTWGECLIGEKDTGELCPVGEEEENFIGWREVIEGDLNAIPNINNETINYYISYLKEEDTNLIDTLHESNKSRHDYKEVEDEKID